MFFIEGICFFIGFLLKLFKLAYCLFQIYKCRLYTIDWVQWRQSYKALVLLEFMLTHGPEEFAQEFQCDVEIIEELGGFTHINEKG